MSSPLHPRLERNWTVYLIHHSHSARRRHSQSSHLRPFAPWSRSVGAAPVPLFLANPCGAGNLRVEWRTLQPRQRPGPRSRRGAHVWIRGRTAPVDAPRRYPRARGHQAAARSPPARIGRLSAGFAFPARVTISFRSTLTIRWKAPNGFASSSRSGAPCPASTPR
jgi:hypothetical protein